MEEFRNEENSGYNPGCPDCFSVLLLLWQRGNGFGEETTKSVTLYPYTDYEKKLEGVSGIGVYRTMLKIQYADGTMQTFHNVPYVIE